VCKRFFLFFLDVCLLGLCPKPHSLFAKREAKILIRILRSPAQSAETAVSAGGAGAAPPQIFTLHIDYTSAFEKSGGFGQRPTTLIGILQKLCPAYAL
jgi:hypothetical protein